MQELKPRPLTYETIRDIDSFVNHIKQGSLKNCVVQGLDVSILCVDWSQVDTENTMFLGCRLVTIEEETVLRKKELSSSHRLLDCHMILTEPLFILPQN